MAEQRSEAQPVRRVAGRSRPATLARLRANFLTGIIVVAPLLITLYLTWTIITFVDSKVVPLIPAPYNPQTYIGSDIPGFGVLVFLGFTTFVGYMAKKVFGRQIIRFGEGLVDRTPIVRSIYNALKQIAETVISQSKTSFRQACLIEYPRSGMWAIAFVATDTKGEIAARTGEDMVSVFMPTTPNPTSGFLLFVPKRDVVMLDMSIEEAAKMIISAGLVAPPREDDATPGKVRKLPTVRPAAGAPAAAAAPVAAQTRQPAE